MEHKELKIILKILSHPPQYRVNSSQLTEKNIPANMRDRLCLGLEERKILHCIKQITKIKISSAGKALLNIKSTDLPINSQELTILKACSQKSITPSETNIYPSTTRTTLINSLIERGFIEIAHNKIIEVELTSWGKEYMLKEYQPIGSGQLNLPKKMVSDYLQFMRKFLPAPTAELTTNKASETQILDIIKQLDKEHNTNNYLPIYQLRNQLQPPFSREELDNILYNLQSLDLIELGTLTELKYYTPEQINQGISQPIGGPLFFITVTE